MILPMWLLRIILFSLFLIYSGDKASVNDLGKKIIHLEWEVYLEDIFFPTTSIWACLLYTSDAADE